MTFSIGIQFIHIVLFGIIIGKNEKRIQKLIGIWFKNQQHTGYSNEIPFLAHEKKRQWIPNYFHCVGEKEGKGSTWRWLGSFVWVVKQIQLGKEQKSTLEICSMENLHSLSLWGKFPPQEQASINISCLKPWAIKWNFHTEQKWQFQTIVVFLLSNQGGKEDLFPWLWNASGVKYNADLNNLSSTLLLCRISSCSLTIVWKQEWSWTRNGGLSAIASTRFSTIVHSMSSSWWWWWWWSLQLCCCWSWSWWLLQWSWWWWSLQCSGADGGTKIKGVLEIHSFRLMLSSGMARKQPVTIATECCHDNRW